ncbi:MAG TPA: hypothetical protein VJ901_04645 [Thermoanaerobaculia bacterium]|nr:hypothetical protein [Thermoanaerobaculia bacterium]
MLLAPYAASTLQLETRALLTRIDRLQPFALVMPMVAAARVSSEASDAIERYLLEGRRTLRARVLEYLHWLRRRDHAARPDEAQRRFAFLKLRFNVVLTHFDIFANALTVRGEIGNGVWLAGLDATAEDALTLDAEYYQLPPVVTYLDRGHGAAIRRARTRLPGGGANPVAIIRVPRERMVGSGIASSLVHEAGHQGAALLDLLPSLRAELRARERASAGPERLAWRLWERWISEIAADFWSVAKLGVAATQGLMGVVSLPRAFVFRVQFDDPHPFPWIRVKLSAAMGRMLHPDPQWALLDQLWEAFYPRTGLDASRLALIEALERSIPAFIELLASHRPAALRGASLGRAFDLPSRRPSRLRALFRISRGGPEALLSLPPTLALAVLGQAKQDRRLTPERESRVVAELLTRIGLRRALEGARAAPPVRVAAA